MKPYSGVTLQRMHPTPKKIWKSMWRLWKRQPKEAKEKQNEEESLGKGYQPSSSSSWSISQPASGKKRKSKKPKGKAIEAEESLQKGVGKVRRASAHAAQKEGQPLAKGSPAQEKEVEVKKKMGLWVRTAWTRKRKCEKRRGASGKGQRRQECGGERRGVFGKGQQVQSTSNQPQEGGGGGLV